MKRFLSLVLTLVMVMSLVTVSAGAKDFTDNDTITYDEAVAVVSEIGVVDGYTDGKFNPTNTLTRQAAAKIICNLKLGPTTAAELHADTAPYKDVPANNEFAGYIAYCQKLGIISGYADGNFRPGNPLTGYAFMKMLLGALGYDASLEGYVGANWSINVAKQALHIGLNKGLVDDFNGIKPVTREEACLYAFRTLQADLVEYGQRLTTNINGTEVTLSSGGAQSREWNSQQSRHDYIREDNIIQFAEEYFNKLEKRKDRDDFERPAYTWIYDKEEIGTYVDWELLVERYTSSVSGRDLYDLLGATAIKDNDLVYYVNGRIPADDHPMNTSAYDRKKVDASKDITPDLLVRSNKDDVGITANGVLTEVFLDKDAELITITSIDTFLGKALADYSESKEYAPVEVYTGMTGATDNKKTTKTTWNVDIEDVKAIEDVKEGDYKLINITFKNEDKGEIVVLNDVEIMEESTVTKFSTHEKTVASKVTVGGTEYKASMRAFFSDDALNDYNETLLTDKTYNVFMDQYGYFIGLELYEGAKNYVFITGFDRPTSNLSVSTAKANGIFLDGTMQNITVNVKGTNDNIADARTAGDDSFNYFINWNETRLPGDEGSYRYNRWFTYSVTNDGVYTLKPCVRMTATKYTKDDTVIRTDNLYVDDNVYVQGKAPYGFNGSQTGVPSFDNGKNFLTGGTTYGYPKTRNERSYGEDETVFITVGLDETDTTDGMTRAIAEVDGVYTGVQNVEIEIEELTDAEEAQIYTVYDSDHYMIAAIAVGEAKGSSATLAYVTGGTKSERIEDGVYYWEFDAILDGTEQTLTAKSKYEVFTNTKAAINREAQGGSMFTDAFGKSSTAPNLYDGLVELRFDADDYVVDVKQIAEKDIYNFYGQRYAASAADALKGAASITTSASFANGAAAPGRSSVPTTEQLDLRDAKAYRVNVIQGNWTDTAGVKHYRDSAPTELFLQGRTLYITEGQVDEGLALASDCKAVVIQKEYGKDDVLTEFTSVDTALKHVADKDKDTTALEFDGEVIAVMNDRGAAAWVIFKTSEELHAGSTPPTPGYSKNVSGTGSTIDPFVVSYHDPDGDMTNEEIKQLVIKEMEKHTGMKVKSYSFPVGNTMVFDDGSAFGAAAAVNAQAKVEITLDGTSLGFINASSTALTAAQVKAAITLANGTYLVNADTANTGDAALVTASAGDGTVDKGFAVDKDVKLYTAGTVTCAAANSITYGNSQTFTSGHYARKGLELTLNKNAAATYQQFNDGTNNFGGQAAPGSDLSAVYRATGSNVTITVVAGYMVMVNGSNGQVMAAASTFNFDYDAASNAVKFFVEKDRAADGSWSGTPNVNSNAVYGTGYAYTVTAADADDGVINLIPVVAVTNVGVGLGWTYDGSPRTIAAGGNTNYLAVGTELTLTGGTTDTHVVKLGGTAIAGGTAADGTNPATAAYEIKAADLGTTLAFTSAAP
nr:S-layer homology domain-containing protein [uncultured Oscillibacter sp.]